MAKINIITEALKDGQSLGGSASFYEDVNVDGETATVITKDGNYTIDYAEAGTQLMHNGNVLTPVSIEPMESQKDGKKQKKKELLAALSHLSGIHSIYFFFSKCASSRSVFYVIRNEKFPIT